MQRGAERLRAFSKILIFYHKRQAKTTTIFGKIRSCFVSYRKGGVPGQNAGNPLVMFSVSDGPVFLLLGNLPQLTGLPAVVLAGCPALHLRDGCTKIPRPARRRGRDAQHLGVWGISPSGSPEGRALWCSPHRRGSPEGRALWRPLRRRIETTGMGDGAIIKLLVEMFELADYFFRRMLL